MVRAAGTGLLARRPIFFDSAFLRGAAKRFLCQTRFRYRSHSDGGGFGGAGAAQPGNRLHDDSQRAGHGGRARLAAESYLLYFSETPACAGEPAGNPWR
jgi:hypothetical protein